MINLIHASINCFKQSFTFSGRTPPQEFWFAQLTIWVPLIIFIMLQILQPKIILDFYASMPYLIQNFLSALMYVAFGFLSVCKISLSCRRLHDINKSGWWQLISLVPILGTALLVYWYIQPSDKQKNNYGRAIISSINYFQQDTDADIDQLYARDENEDTRFYASLLNIKENSLESHKKNPSIQTNHNADFTLFKKPRSR